MTIGKLYYSTGVSYYTPPAVKAQPQAKSVPAFSGGTTKKYNPKISKLESKIESLKAQIQMNPDMLPSKMAEIRAEIDRATVEIKSEPRMIDYTA